MSPLQQATFDELVEELTARSDVMVLGVLLKATKLPSDDGYRTRFGGGRLACRGMINDLSDWAKAPSTFERDHYEKTEDSE